METSYKPKPTNITPITPTHRKLTDPVWISFFLGLPGFIFGFYTIYVLFHYWTGSIHQDGGWELVPAFVFMPFHFVFLIIAWIFLAKSSNEALVVNIGILLTIITFIIVFPFYSDFLRVLILFRFDAGFFLSAFIVMFPVFFLLTGWFVVLRKFKLSSATPKRQPHRLLRP